MHDVTHVAAIDTHAKCDGGSDHRDALIDEIRLNARTTSRVHARMVPRRVDPAFGQGVGDAFNFTARLRIDDATVIRVPLHHLDDLFHLIMALQTTVHQIRTIDVADQSFRVAQRQLGADVILYLWSRSRR